jgi:agmatinase
VGVDVVEVSPPYDHADITAALANRVVLEALSAIARKRKDERDGTRWDPSLPLLSGRNGAIPQGHIPHHHTHQTNDATAGDAPTQAPGIPGTKDDGGNH